MQHNKNRITERQYNRIKRMAEYINELKSIELKELSKNKAQHLIQKYNSDMRLPRKPIFNVFGRDVL